MGYNRDKEGSKRKVTVGSGKTLQSNMETLLDLQRAPKWTVMAEKPFLQTIRNEYMLEGGMFVSQKVSLSDLHIWCFKKKNQKGKWAAQPWR